MHKQLSTDELLQELKDLTLIADKWGCLKEYQRRQLLDLINKAENIAYIQGYKRAMDDIEKI